MALVLEIEYLLGLSFAAVGPDSPLPDWPPQPDRIFSALVATWAARGAARDEIDALEWLERLPPPNLNAPEAESRTGAVVYVPPNDPASRKQKNARGVLPAFRSRRPRRFPATRPHEPVLSLVWPDASPGPDLLAALQRLARDTAYVGHSTSLTRCCFVRPDDMSHFTHAAPPKRSVYPGRFAELRRTFEAGRRPLPGVRVAPVGLPSPPRANCFGERWLVLEHVGGVMPDLRACGLVARTIRATLLSGFERIGLGKEIPQVLSGHSADGAPARGPHVSIVPLAFVGFPHADGHVMGFALVPPADSSILDSEDFRKVLRVLSPIDENRGRRILTVTTKQGTAPHAAFSSIEFSPTFEPSRRSLDPLLYTTPGRTFATLTPIALDRHLKTTGAERQEEIAAQISSACRNIGLPEPAAIVASKHSALKGSPSSYPSGKSPRWTGWRLPASLASRQLTHAVIHFDAAIEGPVILGAGRFTGLGLCRSLDKELAE